MDYKSSGVNIDNGNRAVDLIKDSVKSTYTKHVLSNLGGFAAGVELPLQQYKKPILVSCTDGVGTKLRFAIEFDCLDTIGIDCVAMSVNDLLCMGADPLFFLDYIACHKIEPDDMKLIVDGVAEGCKQARCALVGGEMAEMNDMYKEKDFDIAGFCVGIVDKEDVITGKTITEGDKLYALPASGIHSNGYSLVRKVYNETEFSKHVSEKELLEPTKIYVDEINALKTKHHITGIANITGGGIAENLVRVLPKGLTASVKKSSIQVLPVFDALQHYGSIKEDEMYRVFNMGVGMIIVSPDDLSNQQGLYQIGHVESGNQEVHLA
ncbi:phosphoribosylformylglycinamidine cyclo-ligase [Candidatus Marinamargulisbacteria bacterium SCGC AG-343-D04]|nr:phosphoribosylformylglycinamidine cyclo-ligase [Candidatus Marinamargulisbacteria bacterium SCGC AG-343-D04]